MATATQTAGNTGPGPSGPDGLLASATAAGREAAESDEQSLREATKRAALEQLVLRNPNPTAAFNLAAGAVMLLITLMIVLLAALVGGKFAAAVPSDSVFSNAITTTTDNAGTAFVIFGVSLLAIPTVSVLAYVVMKLGPFIGFGGGGGSIRNLGRR